MFRSCYGRIERKVDEKARKWSKQVDCYRFVFFDGNDLFGEKAYNKTLGLVVSVNTAGYALGAPLASLCRDIIGSYTFSLWLGAGLMFALIILIQFVINASNKERKAVYEREEKDKESFKQCDSVA